MVKWTDVLIVMEQKLAGGKPRPFDLAWLTFDEARKTAGSKKELRRAVLVGIKQKKRMVNIAPYGLPNQIISVHWDLILWINDKPTS
ncbi:hypothetical protein [Runella sp.]|uniref:hypothetical protein n=1 Tax=Runella sp. TaxID=1960881 RepID=UPI003D0C74E0